jgi:hypothetical protein
MASSSETAAFLGVFQTVSMGSEGPLVIEAHGVGFQLVRADLTIGGVEEGE